MTLTIAHMLVRITGVLLLILGLLFWTGELRQFIPVHILIGVLMVLALWLLAATASQLNVPIGMVAGAALLGLIALVLGLVQTSLLPGSTHWVIQVLHLLIGMLAVGSGEMIGGRVRRNRLAASPA